MLKIGHRGACGYEPENTLLSFQRALEMGADAIELDVHQCASGEIIVIHDDRFERTTDGQGLVIDTSLSQIKAFNAGSGEAIPTLEEAIEFIHRRAVMFIELKDDISATKVAQIITRFVEEKDWRYEHFVVISFIHHELLKVSAENPLIPTGATIVGHPVNHAEIATLAKAKAINPALDFINEELVADAHARGLKVIAWTANEPDQIARARRLQVDGIISDYPDRL